MFQDEARFGRINDPKRCWSPKRTRPTVGKQIIREYTFEMKSGLMESFIAKSAGLGIT